MSIGTPVVPIYNSQFASPDFMSLGTGDLSSADTARFPLPHFSYPIFPARFFSADFPCPIFLTRFPPACAPRLVSPSLFLFPGSFCLLPFAARWQLFCRWAHRPDSVGEHKSASLVGSSLACESMTQSVALPACSCTCGTVAAVAHRRLFRW